MSLASRLTARLAVAALILVCSLAGAAGVAMAQTTVSGGTPSGRITLATPNVTVPVVITRTSGSPAVFAYSVVFRANSPLVLPAGKSSITLPPGGGFLNADGGRNVSLQTIDQGGGVYKADGVTLGLPCGSSALSGTLFNVALTSSALGGSPTLEILSVTLRDCGNVTIPATVGSASTVVINRSTPAVSVLSPDGGENLAIGSTFNVTWSATDDEGVASVDLAYSLDGGSNFPFPIATGIANSGSYAWLVPNAPSSTVRVRVTARDIDANAADDASDLDFTIACPTITVTSATTHVACFGGSTGASDISVSGGTAPYTYLWGDGPTSEDRSGLAAGVYSVTATDANGCTGTLNITVNEPSPLVGSASAGTILCNGGTTTVVISASGGTAPYTGTGSFVVSAGPYSYTVTDANGCTTTVSGTITQPAPLVGSASAGTILCNGGTTTVVISASGGTAPYTGTGSFVVGAGSYSYVVTDANGCTTTVSGTITEPSPLVGSATAGTILCNGGTTTVVISASGGTAPYTGTGSFVVSAGPYSYTVTDANGCTTTVSGTITEPSSLVGSATAGTILCNGGTTTVVISASGGTAPYTGTGSFVVSAGSYSYLVTDANGCTTTVSGTITQPTPLVGSASAGTILCNGGTTTVVISASGGTSPYTGTGSFVVSAGPYSYTVTDANGCTTTVSGTITQPTPLVGSASAGTILCNGGTTTLVISASGGTSPYTGTGSFVVSAGPYSYTVTDANGCTTTVSGTITQPTPLVGSASAGTILCNGGTTTLVISASGGAAPYTGTGSFVVGAGPYSYLVTDANGCATTVSGTITEPTLLVGSASAGTILCNGGTTTVVISASGGTAPYTGTGSFVVSAGPYSYTVTDANGCATTVSGTITQPTPLVGSASAGTILCNGGTTTLVISASGGTAPYTGTGSFVVSAGPYSYTVTDANGCTTTVSGTITAADSAGRVRERGHDPLQWRHDHLVISASGGTAPYTGTGSFVVGAGPYSYL